MIRFSLNTFGVEKLDFALAGLTAQIGDWREVWPKVSDKLAEIEHQLFESAGAAGEHGRWPDLKPSYARAKERKWGQAAPLQASGRLRTTLAGQSSEGINRHEPLLLRWGTEVPYAVFHQAGTRKMPARRLLDFTEEDRQEFGKTLQREAMNLSQRLGFALSEGI